MLGSQAVDLREIEDDECAMKLYYRFRSYSLPGTEKLEGKYVDIVLGYAPDRFFHNY